MCFKFRNIANLALLVLFISILPAGAGAVDWQWIYSDDTVSVYADFEHLKIWDKPEGKCVNVNLKSRLTEKGASEIVVGREINKLDTTGWNKLQYVFSRQLFLMNDHKVQMMEVSYMTDELIELSHDKFSYSAERWTDLRKKERSLKVYDAIMQVAKNITN